VVVSSVKRSLSVGVATCFPTQTSCAVGERLFDSQERSNFKIS
jgi:hypothetical protein